LRRKDLRQKDFSRFLAISAQRKRAFLSFLPLRARFPYRNIRCNEVKEKRDDGNE
jgi:hypothetical protein